MATPKYLHPEPLKVTLYEIRVFADTLKASLNDFTLGISYLLIVLGGPVILSIPLPSVILLALFILVLRA